MDILGGVRVAIDTFWYNIVLSLAGLHWSLLRGFVMMGYTVELVNRWLAERAFAPLIRLTTDSLDVAVSLAFVVALFVLGMTYLLAAFIRLEVVNPRSAITWYVAGALFFSLGPSLYRGMQDFRTTVAQAFYLSTLQGLQDNTGGTFDSLGQVDSADLGLGPLCDNLGVYLPGAAGPGGIDGLDVALAYLRADGPDVMGYPQPVYSPGCPYHALNPLTGAYISQVPQEWFLDGSYFDAAISPLNFDDMDNGERAASISRASSAHGRMFTAWPLVLFGVVEQIVYLLITIAQGITFISFAVAILFAFFKRTEVIAHSIINQWIELIVQTVIIALVQSLVVALFLAGTTSSSSMVVLGIGLICLIFMVIVLWSGVKAVWNSFNRLFFAMGQAAGGTILSPGLAAAMTASAGAGAVGSAVSVGSNALAGMTALQQGATMAQAAGISFGGSRTLSGAARTLAYLPGVRNTSLGDAAEQFTEGSITRQVARNVPVVGRIAGPMVGARLLTDRDPDRAEYDDQGRVLARPMLVPAVGEGLERWTLPRGAQRRQRPLDDLDFVEDEDGELLPVGSFTPARHRRMGVFTPVNPVSEAALPTGDEGEARQQHERSDHTAEMVGEEMEQHVSDVMRTNTGLTSPLGAMLKEDGASDAGRLGQVASRLEATADMLMRAAQMQLLVGQLRVTGVPDVAGVLGDVVGQVQNEREKPGQSPAMGQHVGIDHLQTGDRMARVMGVTPQVGGSPPIQRDLSRFGLFVDQALRLGLTPQQTEQVVREVQTSPEGKMQPGTRETLDKQVQTTQNVSWIKARDEVDRLEHSAQMLPQEITAFGTMHVPVEALQPSVTVEPEVHVDPKIEVNVQTGADDAYEQAMKKESALGGSGSVLGGSS